MGLDVEKFTDNAVKKANSVDVAKKIANPDNAYKWFAYSALVIAIVSAVLMMGIVPEFKWDRLLKADFWFPFIVTLLISQALYSLFGRLGIILGNGNKQVNEQLRKNEELSKDIETRQLNEELDTHIVEMDMMIKLTAIRNKAYRRLNGAFSWLRRKHWERVRKAVLLQEKLYNTLDKEEALELSEILKSLNFDIKSFKIKYNKLDRRVLSLGFVNAESGWNSLRYSENYEMFGKSAFVKVFTTIGGFLIAIIQFFGSEITIAAVTLLVYRILIYSYNSFIGYINGRHTVEVVKYEVLKNIHLFLQLFLEKVGGGKYGNK